MSEEKVKQFTLGVIGGGFMAKAIVEGAICAGILAPEEIAISEPDGEKRAVFSSLGIKALSDNRFLAENCRYLLFAIKPQSFSAVAEELHGTALPVIISIMAGKTKRFISQSLGSDCAVARIMPNLPCSIGEGVSGVSAENLSEEEQKFIIGLFSAVGKAVSVREEQLNAVTGISGSGPAYVYLFLKSLVEAGVKEGLDEEEAKIFALQTVKGGVVLAEQSDRTLDELIAAVSSKGGTTLAALDRFERDDFAGSISRAVAAAVRRAEELAQ